MIFKKWHISSLQWSNRFPATWHTDELSTCLCHRTNNDPATQKDFWHDNSLKGFPDVVLSSVYRSWGVRESRTEILDPESQFVNRETEVSVFTSLQLLPFPKWVGLVCVSDPLWICPRSAICPDLDIILIDYWCKWICPEFNQRMSASCSLILFGNTRRQKLSTLNDFVLRDLDLVSSNSLRWFIGKAMPWGEKRTYQAQIVTRFWTSQVGWVLL